MESEPLLNREGALYLCTLYDCVQKRGDGSPISKYRGIGIYSMNKPMGRRHMFITRAKAASWFSSCSAPSQPLLKPLLWDEIPLWLWALWRVPCPAWLCSLVVDGVVWVTARLAAVIFVKTMVAGQSCWKGRRITINVPLFKKLRDIIFFWWENHFMSHFEGHFEGGKTFLTP